MLYETHVANYILISYHELIEPLSIHTLATLRYIPANSVCAQILWQCNCEYLILVYFISIVHYLFYVSKYSLEKIFSKDTTEKIFLCAEV